MGAATGGLKSLAGQLFDGKKGVDFSQVGKDALGGAAGSIPIVGGMLKNKITGGGAQAPQVPGMPQVPGAVGPGGFGGLFGQGGGAGLMNLAQNALGMEHGGGIPHNPELAGAPYKMRGVRLMKSGGINEYGDGGAVDYNNGGKQPAMQGEMPGLDLKTRKTQVGFDVEKQQPIYDDVRTIFLDGVPISGVQGKAYMDEKMEGLPADSRTHLGEALHAAQMRRIREESGRDYLGPGMYRSFAEEDLDKAQKKQGATGLLKALGEYNTSRGTKDYGRGGYLR